MAYLEHMIEVHHVTQTILIDSHLQFPLPSQLKMYRELSSLVSCRAIPSTNQRGGLRQGDLVPRKILKAVSFPFP